MTSSMRGREILPSGRTGNRRGSSPRSARRRWPACPRDRSGSRSGRAPSSGRRRWRRLDRSEHLQETPRQCPSRPLPPPIFGPNASCIIRPALSMELQGVLALVAAGLALGMGCFVLLRNPRAFVHRTVALGMASLGLEQALLGAAALSSDPFEIARWQQFGLMALSLVPGTWLLFGLTFARANPRQFVAWWRPASWRPVGIPLAIVVVGRSALFTGIGVVDPPRVVLRVGWAGYCPAPDPAAERRPRADEPGAHAEGGRRHDALGDQVHGARRGRLLRRPDLYEQPGPALPGRGHEPPGPRRGRPRGGAGARGASR